MTTAIIAAITVGIVAAAVVKGGCRHGDIGAFEIGKAILSAKQRGWRNG